MAEERPNPLVAASERKLVEADARGGAKIVHWLPDKHCWTVPSSDPTKQGYEVRRKHPPVDRTPEEYAASRARSKGQWWFILDCSCPAATAGYAVCWHKAAVFRWWQAYRRVDGDAYGDTLPFSPAAAHANSDTDDDGVERWKDRQQYDRAWWERAERERPLGSVYYDVDEDGNTYRVPGPAPDGLPPDTTDAEIHAVDWWDNGPMSNGTCDDLERVP